MMELLVSILLVYGITNIIVRGVIFDGIKDKLEDLMFSSKGVIKWFLSKFLTLTNCPMCTGFWIGAAIGALYGPFEQWNVLFNGAFYSGTCWLLHCVTQYLGQGQEPDNNINIFNKFSVEEYEDEDDEEPETKKEVLLG